MKILLRYVVAVVLAGMPVIGAAEPSVSVLREGREGLVCGFAVADVGKTATHESGEPFAIGGVPDKDHVLLHPEGKPGAKPCFPYLPKGSFTCGVRSWEPTETSRNEL